MDDTLKIAIPSAIVLTGTLITIFVGYRQWKRQQEVARYGNFLMDKQSAYKGLWEKLEEVHIKLRARDISQSEFDKLIHKVNSYLLKQSLYLDEKDSELANKYLAKVYELKILVDDSDDEPIKRDWLISISVMQESQLGENVELNKDLVWEKLGSSSEVPKSTVEMARKIRHPQTDVNLIRNLIIERCRKVMGGNLV